MKNKLLTKNHTKMKRAINQNPKSKETRYFSIPLSLLTLTDDPETLYHYIYTYFITLHSGPYASRIDEKEFEMMMEYEEYDIKYRIADDYDFGEHLIMPEYVAYTARRFGMDDDFIYECLESFEEVTDFYLDYCNRYGEDTIVRVRKDIVEDMRSGEIDMNLFRAFCAIVSFIGKEPYKRVANSIISVRSAGFKSKAVLDHYKDSGKLFPEPLTVSQVKTATKKLVERGFLLRLTLTNNRTYYCIRLKPEDFAKRLAEKLHKEYEKKAIDVFQNKLDTLAKALATKHSFAMSSAGRVQSRK